MDIQKILPIHQKRIVTFMNYFIVDTVSFMNKFINSTEESLWKMEKKMRKLETSLKLLEMKLNCVPDIQKPADVRPPENEESETPSVPPTEHVEETGTEDIVDNEEKIPENLKKYYKMYQVGVPLNAVKSKMKLEGFDPELLKSP